MTVFAATMIIFFVAFTARPIPLMITVILLALWSAAAWSVPPAIQSIMVSLVPESSLHQAMALNSSAVYLGAAAGGTVGGAALALGPQAVPVAAGVAAVLAIGLLVCTARASVATEQPSRVPDA